MLLGPGRRHLVAVGARRLVAMMAVGDEHRLRPQEPGHLGYRCLVNNGPHPARHSQVISRLHRRLAGHGGIERLLHLALRVGVEPKHLAEVGPAGTGEQQAILLRAAHRLLVGMDVAGAKPLEPHPRHHAPADELPPLDLELLVVDVERRRRLLHHHPLLPPRLQILGGPGVFVALLVIARLLPVELQPDHVGRVLLVELRLQVRIDHVVGRRDHLRQRADVLGVVAEATERGDGGHGARCLEGVRTGVEKRRNRSTRVTRFP